MEKPRKENRQHQSITNRTQEGGERISGVEDTREETDASVNENVKSKKISDTKHPENLGCYEKTFPANNRNRKR